MARMYTLDNKLLTGTPEIRIGDKVYPVDDRVKTVKKIMKLYENNKDQSIDDAQKVLEIAFGAEAAKEIDGLELPFAAYQQLMQLVMSAMTGEEPEKAEERFQETEQ